MDVTVAREMDQASNRRLLEGLTARLPEWIAQDQSNRHYAEQIGRALIAAVERRLREEKVRFLFVKTLHPDVDYEPYQRTRSFYVRLGFEFALSAGQGSSGSSPDPLAYYLKSL